MVSRLSPGQVLVSLARLIAIALVVMAAGSSLALLLDQGERGRTSTKTVTVGATETVTATKTVTQAAEAPGATGPAEPEIPEPVKDGAVLQAAGFTDRLDAFDPAAAAV